MQLAILCVRCNLHEYFYNEWNNLIWIGLNEVTLFEPTLAIVLAVFIFIE